MNHAKSDVYLHALNQQAINSLIINVWYNKTFNKMWIVLSLSAFMVTISTTPYNILLNIKLCNLWEKTFLPNNKKNGNYAGLCVVPKTLWYEPVFTRLAVSCGSLVNWVITVYWSKWVGKARHLNHRIR